MDVEAVLVLCRRMVNEGVWAVVPVRVLVADLVQVVGHAFAAVFGLHAATVAAIDVASENRPRPCEREAPRTCSASSEAVPGPVSLRTPDIPDRSRGPPGNEPNHGAPASELIDAAARHRVLSHA